MRTTAIRLALSLLAAAPLAASAAPGPAAPASRSPEESAIRAKVEKYLHGLKFNDV